MPTEQERLAVLETDVKGLWRVVAEHTKTLQEVRDDMASSKQNWAVLKAILGFILVEVTLLTGVLGIFGVKLLINGGP